MGWWESISTDFYWFAMRWGKRGVTYRTRGSIALVLLQLSSHWQAEEEHKTEVETNGNQDSLQGSSWASKKSFEWLLQRIHNAWKWRPLPWITEERKQNEMIFVFWTKKKYLQQAQISGSKEKKQAQIWFYTLRREKSNFYPRTIAEVWFSTFNYETGQHRPFNCQDRANLAFGVVLKVVLHFSKKK